MVFGTYQQIDSGGKKRLRKHVKTFKHLQKFYDPPGFVSGAVWITYERPQENCSLKQINSGEVSPVSSASVCF